MFPIKKSSQPLGESPKEIGTYNVAYSDGDANIIVNCPKCNHTTTLKEYKVEPSGQVFPSFICKADGCKFHELIKLENWSSNIK